LLINGLLEVSKLDERAVYKAELNERNFVIYCTNNLVVLTITFTLLINFTAKYFKDRCKETKIVTWIYIIQYNYELSDIIIYL